MPLNGDDEALLTSYWDTVLIGGTVQVLFEQAPWGGTFGIVDKFGVS